MGKLNVAVAMMHLYPLGIRVRLDLMNMGQIAEVV